MMQHIGLGGFLLAILYAVLSGDFIKFLDYLTKYPRIVPPIAFLSVLGVLG